MEATAAIMKDTMTPGPAISLATSPDTTYIPVPTQLPTPSDTRSTVDSTRASLVPCELVPDMDESSMDSTGLVLRIRVVNVLQAEPHCTLRGSSFPARPLILRAKGQVSGSKGEKMKGLLCDCFFFFYSLLFIDSKMEMNCSLYDGGFQSSECVLNFHVLDYFSGTSSCPHMVIENLSKQKIKVGIIPYSLPHMVSYYPSDMMSIFNLHKNSVSQPH